MADMADTILIGLGFLLNLQDALLEEAPRLLHKASEILTVEQKVCCDGKYIW